MYVPAAESRPEWLHDSTIHEVEFILSLFFRFPKNDFSTYIILENVYCFNDIQMCTSIDYHPPPNQDLNTVLYLIPTNTDVPSKYEIKTKEIGNNTNTPAAAAKYWLG